MNKMSRKSSELCYLRKAIDDSELGIRVICVDEKDDHRYFRIDDRVLDRVGVLEVH